MSLSGTDSRHARSKVQPYENFCEILRISLLECYDWRRLLPVAKGARESRPDLSPHE